MNRITMRVDVRLSKEDSYPGLELQETCIIKADNFDKLAAIMSRFHKVFELFEEIKNSEK